MPFTSHVNKLAPPALYQTNKPLICARAAEQLFITVPPYLDMEEGDLIELFWDGCYVTSRQLVKSDIGQPCQLRVPESFIQNGSARLYYRVMHIGSSPALSAQLKVLVKLDCPGGKAIGEENQGLAPVGIPGPIQRYGVNASQMKRGVPLIIEPYPNMAIDDAITLMWGDIRMDVPKLRREDIGQAVNVFVPPDIIQEAGEDTKLEVTYCVIDRVGNNSRWAPARTLKVGANRRYVNPTSNALLRVAEPRPNWRD
ncbi:MULTISPECIES: hypothetical protein [unclassified Pseudomonas]|jgi:hypothetical protein|uniref:hypothetical protein n=1 Tax=unclassified Pseudomonas TaxID=196821 RepID=UPI000756F3A6|nr:MULTISPECIES: hypothetical protein [unclassified Pseudomonas]KVV01363.1 hypothetical protein AP060_04079 [Pseudomonas sp. TAD18]KVV02721.1 hypothetical protein AP059_04061 [Pseudomonas sp. TAA207]